MTMERPRTNPRNAVGQGEDATFINLLTKENSVARMAHALSSADFEEKGLGRRAAPEYGIVMLRDYVASAQGAARAAATAAEGAERLNEQKEERTDLFARVRRRAATVAQVATARVTNAMDSALGVRDAIPVAEVDTTYDDPDLGDLDDWDDIDPEELSESK
jgi:hypothetical protein